MSDLSVAEVAQKLAQARREHVQWTTGDAEPLGTVEDAYRVQDLVADELGAEFGAWKTSATDSQSSVMVAPIYKSLIYPNGIEIPASEFFVLGIEGEVAFRMSRDLPAREQPYDRQEMFDSISEMLPVIELVDTRMIDGLTGNKELALADNQSNGGLVVGSGKNDWSDPGLSSQTGSVTINGKVAYSGVHENPAGDLFHLLARAVNHCAAHNRPVRTGDIITTGSSTGILFAEPGSEVVVELPAIGRVEVAFPT